MYDLNQNFSRFPGGYLFAAVRQKKEEFQRSHPDADVISLGIGDVTKPLCPVVMKALEDAAAEMGDAATFRGYGPYEGYAFLREAIARVDFQQYGVKILPDEILHHGPVLGQEPDCYLRADIPCVCRQQCRRRQMRIF